MKAIQTTTVEVTLNAAGTDYLLPDNAQLQRKAITIVGIEVYDVTQQPLCPEGKTATISAAGLLDGSLSLVNTSGNAVHENIPLRNLNPALNNGLRYPIRASDIVLTKSKLRFTRTTNIGAVTATLIIRFECE